MWLWDIKINSVRQAATPEKAPCVNSEQKSKSSELLGNPEKARWWFGIEEPDQHSAPKNYRLGILN